MEKKYLIREEAADYLGVSLSHLSELLKEPNPLPAFKVGRRWIFRTSDIDRWLEKFRVSDVAEGLH